jgi:DNA-binding transcriptional MocR family regulator
VVFTPGNAFFVDGGGERMLRLSFSALPLAQIDEGIRRLGEAIRDLERQPEPVGLVAAPAVPLV